MSEQRDVAAVKAGRIEDAIELLEHEVASVEALLTALSTDADDA